MSLWLNSGVPATEAARRAGHGVAVLLKIYAHCIDGQAGPLPCLALPCLAEVSPFRRIVTSRVAEPEYVNGYPDPARYLPDLVDG